MKVTITRSGGYDPRLGPDHQSNLDPTLEAHTVVVDTDSDELFALTCRWRCSCGAMGKWRTSALSARRGGEQHRAKMEK